MAKSKLTTTDVEHKLDIYQFGKKLLATRDLDPVYCVVRGAQLERSLLEKWLLAYWCFYHCGTASWLAWYGQHSEVQYWEGMRLAASSKDFPRASERRHFRGKAAKESVAYLSKQGIGKLFEPLTKNRTYDLQQVMKQVQTWRGYGPWIAFKVADMLERLGLTRIEFDTAALCLFDSPRKAAELLWIKQNEEESMVDGVEQWAVDSILSRLGHLKAPPRYERLIHGAEAETILCKWGSYAKGHYEVGKDIGEVHHALLKFVKCPISQRLLEAGRQEKLWDFST